MSPRRVRRPLTLDLPQQPLLWEAPGLATVRRRSQRPRPHWFFRLWLLAVLAAGSGGWWAYDRWTSGRVRPAAWQDPIRQEFNGLRSWGGITAFEQEGIAACALVGNAVGATPALERFFPERLSALHGVWQELLPWSWDWIFPWNLNLTWQSLGLACARLNLPSEFQVEHPGWPGGQVPSDAARYERLLLRAPAWRWRGLGWGLAANHRTPFPLLVHEFEWPAAERFDRTKVVLRVQPERGLPYLSVAWPGLSGAVTGLNQAGIGVVLLPAPGPTRAWGRALAPIVAAQVLAQAKDLATAIQLVQASRLASPHTFLLGSGRENRFAAIEVREGASEVRSLSNGWLSAGGEFLAPGWNDRDRRMSARLRRLQERWQAHTGPFTVETLVSWLRDTRGTHGQTLGWGHPAALNALRNGHCAILDLEHRTVWVAAAPQGLGAFVPFNLDGFAPALASRVLPAASSLAAGQYGVYQEYQGLMAEATRFLRTRRLHEALSRLAEARLLEPNAYLPCLLAARALQTLQRWDEAAYNLRAALQRTPATPAERREIEQRLQEIHSHLH